MIHFLRGLLLVLLLAGPSTAQTVDVPASQKPACEEAPDDQYGYVRTRAIQVGGSPMYGAARQRRYLDVLVGPERQPVTYRRRGQDRAPDGTILDAYEVTHAGLEKPIILFLDWYHYTPPRLPRGFSCSAPFNLGVPPVDPFQESRQLRVVAIAQAAAAEISPITAGVEGKPPSVAIYDGFRLFGLAARAAAAKGKTIDPEVTPADLERIGMVVLVYPFPCQERLLPTAGVGIHGQNGAMLPREQNQALSPEQLARILPGVTIPSGAKAFAYQIGRVRPNDTVIASYMEDGCDVIGNIVRLPFRQTPVKAIDTPTPEPQKNVTGPTTVFLQAIVDLEGRLQDPVYIGGPTELEAAARETIRRWRAEPARFNGTPVATGVVLQVRFGNF